MTQKVVLALLVAVGLASGCAETRRSNGEDCLKSQDCLSGICSQLVCVEAPPTTSTMTQGDGGTADTGGSSGGDDSGGGQDAAPEAQAEAGPEAGPDAGSDAAGD